MSPPTNDRCPMPPLLEVGGAARRFYHPNRDRTEERSKPNPLSDLDDYQATWAISRGGRSEFTLHGELWTRQPLPEIAWEYGPGDATHLPPQEDGRPRMSPRHFHATFQFRGVEIHVDYTLFMSFGPLSGTAEFQVYADGRFITRGGHFAHPPGGSYRNWPLAARIQDFAVVISSNPTKTDLPLGGFDGLSIWEVAG